MSSADLSSYSAKHRDSTLMLYRRAVEKVILGMHDRLHEPLNLATLANIASTSPYHFIRVFQQITGVSPVKFLTALRIEKAKQLLLSTDLSVTDICFNVGYNSLGSFTTIFTKAVGISPCQLRQLVINSSIIPDYLYEKSDRLLQIRGWRRPRIPGINGRLVLPSDFSGITFIGLFSSLIPQGQPTAGTFLTEPGSFRIANVPEGQYHILTVAIPFAKNPVGYVVLNPTSIYVDKQTITVSPEHYLSCSVDLILRPFKITDPPILVALPFLLAKHLAVDTG